MVSLCISYEFYFTFCVFSTPANQTIMLFCSISSSILTKKTKDHCHHSFSLIWCKKISFLTTYRKLRRRYGCLYIDSSSLRVYEHRKAILFCKVMLSMKCGLWSSSLLFLSRIVQVEYLLQNYNFTSITKLMLYDVNRKTNLINEIDVGFYYVNKVVTFLYSGKKFMNLIIRFSAYPYSFWPTFTNVVPIKWFSRSTIFRLFVNFSFVNVKCFYIQI